MKRFLSLFLSLCIMISILPAGRITAFAEDNVTTYAFNAKAYGVNDHLNFLKVTFEQTNGLFAYNSSSKIAAADGRTDSRLDITLQSTITESIGAYLALDMTVADAGVYNIAYEAYRKSSGGLAGEIYLLPGGTDLSNLEAAKAAGIRIPCVDGSGNIYNNGIIDYYTSIYLKAKKTGVNLTAGTYILLITVSGAHSAFEGKYDVTGSYYIAPKVLTLTRTGDLPPYELLSGKKYLTPGETTSLSVFDYDGNAVSEFEVKSISSSDNDIAVVDGDTMTVTGGTKNGKAKITATLIVNGSEIVAEGTVELENTDDLTGEYVYELSFLKYMEAMGYEDTLDGDNKNLKLFTLEKEKILGYNAHYNVGTSVIRRTPRFNLALQTAVEDSIGAWIAFDIELERSGLYTSLFETYRMKSGAEISGMLGDVYILPYSGKVTDIQSAMASGMKIASDVDYSAAEAKFSKDKLYLQKGKHTLVFYCKGKGKSTTDIGTKLSTYSMDFKQLSLTWNGMPTNQLIPERYHLAPGETVSLSVLDYKDDEISSFTVKEISSSDDEIATVDRETMTVTAGDKLGSAKISAVITVDGKDLKSYGYVRTTVTEESDLRIIMALDERKNTWVNPAYERMPEKYSNTLSNAQVDIAGFEPGEGITAEYTDGWSWYGDSNPSHDYKDFYQGNGSWMRFLLAEGGWAAVKRTFDSAGHYRASISHKTYAASMYGTDVYLIPVPGDGETVEDYLTPDYKVGWFQNSRQELAAGTGMTDLLGDAYIDVPGEYLVVFVKNSKGNGGGDYLYVNDIIFSGASPVTEMESVHPGALMIGDKISITKDIIKWESDIPAYAKDSEMLFRSLTEDVVMVDENGTVT
ncbi:MAG: hypothetical protein IJF32_13095, partial [Oscillospiraceae bacterium]|nr:hypothetical protein [Oscillospiraceae bacterium]